MSARRMALAKAFPDHFTYLPREAEAVSRWDSPDLTSGLSGVRGAGC